eukprot:4310021-Prymnesium_polylepis.1
MINCYTRTAHTQKLSRVDHSVQPPAAGGGAMMQPPHRDHIASRHTRARRGSPLRLGSVQS